MQSDPTQKLRDELFGEASIFANACLTEAIRIVSFEKRIPWTANDASPMIGHIARIIGERVNTKLMIVEQMRKEFENVRRGE